MVFTHSGGGGTLNPDSDLTHDAMSSDLTAMAVTAPKRGTTMTISSINVMTAAAYRRRPQRIFWSLRRTGHVATTMIVAQIMDVRKGRSIQKLAAIRIPMNSTASIVRVMSCLEKSCELIFVSPRESIPV